MAWWKKLARIGIRVAKYVPPAAPVANVVDEVVGDALLDDAKPAAIETRSDRRRRARRARKLERKRNGA